MGHYTAYYVPLDQTRHLGRIAELLDAFWEIGIVLNANEEQIQRKLDWCRKNGTKPPQCQYEYSFGGQGLKCDDFEIPIPHAPYGISCPFCREGLFDEAFEVWQSETEPWVPLPDRFIRCTACDATFPSRDLIAPPIGFCFAGVYLWINDITPTQLETGSTASQWDPAVKVMVESILGECVEIIGWDT